MSRSNNPQQLLPPELPSITIKYGKGPEGLTLYRPNLIAVGKHVSDAQKEKLKAYGFQYRTNIASFGVYRMPDGFDGNFETLCQRCDIDPKNMFPFVYLTKTKFPYIADPEIYLVFQKNTLPEIITQTLQQHHLTITDDRSEKYDDGITYVVACPPLTDSVKIVFELQQNAHVKVAEPDLATYPPRTCYDQTTFSM